MPSGSFKVMLTTEPRSSSGSLGRTCPLSARDRTDHEEGFLPEGDVIRQWRVRRLVRQIQLAREEPYERATFPSRVVTDGAPQHRIAGLQCVEHRALRYVAFD